MDDIDIKLISLLSENARMSLKQLAQEVFLSPPAVSARIERLENNGFISGYAAKVNYAKLGYQVTAFVQLAMMPECKPAFTDYITSCTNVLECYNVTGAYSMLIKVCFPSTEELSGFVGELQSFGKTQTQVVFSALVKQRAIRGITPISRTNP